MKLIAESIKYNPFSYPVPLGHLVILFNGPPKPEACWRGRSWDKYEKLILTVGSQHNQNLNSV